MKKDAHGHIVVEAHTRKKYKILGKFLKMASAKAQFFWGGSYYIETHAGTGKVFFEDTQEDGNGSVLITLNNSPTFKRYFLIENDGNSMKVLESEIKQFIEQGLSIDTIKDDCNCRVDDIVKEITNGSYSFVFIDPEGYDFKWTTVLKLMEITKKGKVDFFINLPTGGILRNRIRRDLTPEEYDKIKCQITDMMGTSGWKSKRSSKQIAELFESQMKSAFPYPVYVHHEPVKTQTKSTIYHLIFVTNNEEVFKKYCDIVNRLESAKIMPKLTRFLHHKK